ncbi:DNA-adenine methylase (Dam) (PDB:4GOL), partial [Commensalibacter communis]
MRNFVSPLRYPGGKACLYNMLVPILHHNNLNEHYAEPYAGGCGLALSLLIRKNASHIHINDLDITIWAFWHCILNQTEEFIQKIVKTPITLEQWHIQRAIHKQQNTNNLLDLGFSTFFLNRTNRSGIIKWAGPIGGLKQEGKYKLDCRFNKEALIKRIQTIHSFKSQITLTNMDAIDFINHCNTSLPSNSLLFIDPPYYNKGAELYTNFYKKTDHQNLSKIIQNIHCPWLIT